MSILVREAKKEDAAFIAQMVLQSTRAGKAVGMFDLIFDINEDKEILSLLEAFVATSVKHQYHYSNFLIAQIDSQDVGTLCSYEPRVATRQNFIDALAEIDVTQNVESTLKIFDECDFNLTNRVLMFDCMEELEGFVDLDVLKTLMQKTLLKARMKGYSVAQTIVEIGSLDTLLFYKKLGFKEVKEVECELYKEYLGRLGLILLKIEF